MEWSCWKTADHTVDCVFSYAFFLASRRQDTYPPFGELHALPNATPTDLVDGLQASATMLSAVIATAEPDARAVIGLWPHAQTGTPRDFAARGALEMILHAYDVCTGLDTIGAVTRHDTPVCPEIWSKLDIVTNDLKIT